jgi:hypothetical protein
MGNDAVNANLTHKAVQPQPGQQKVPPPQPLNNPQPRTGLQKWNRLMKCMGWWGLLVTLIGLGIFIIGYASTPNATNNQSFLMIFGSDVLGVGAVSLFIGVVGWFFPNLVIGVNRMANDIGHRMHVPSYDEIQAQAVASYGRRLNDFEVMQVTSYYHQQKQSAQMDLALVMGAVFMIHEWGKK